LTPGFQNDILQTIAIIETGFVHCHD
jgi:hypothetical protein